MTPFAIDPLSPQTVLPTMPRGMDDAHRLARKSPMAIAREFESILVAQVIGAMRKTVSSVSSLFGGDGPNKILDGAFDQQLAESITKRAHLGIADRLAAQIERHAHATGATAAGGAGHAGGAASGADTGPGAALPATGAVDADARVPSEHDVGVAGEAVAQLVGGGEGHLTSGFGLRHDPITGRTAFHGGIDVAAPRGSAIHAVAGGEVVFSGRRGRAGNVVDVRDGDVISTYAHVQRALVRAGQKVAAGDVVATVGSTGRSTGPHVHFSVTREGQTIDPAALLDSGRVPEERQLMAAADPEES